MEKVKVRMVIEILGKPKDHVEKTLKEVIGKLKAEKNIKNVSEKIFDAQPIENNKYFSTFAELEMDIELSSLIYICFYYMPSSIEILEPQELKYKSLELSDFVNDLLSRLHNFDMVVKKMHAENIKLKRELENKNN